MIWSSSSRTTRLTRWAALRGLVAGAAAALTGASLFADDAEGQNRDRRGGKFRAKVVATVPVP